MNVIETGGLARRFGRFDAVRGLDLYVPAGSVFALVGPNGAGKAIAIKLLMNLLRPSGARRECSASIRGRSAFGSSRKLATYPKISNCRNG